MSGCCSITCRFYFFIRHLFTESVGEKVSDILTALRTCPFNCAVLLYTDLLVIKYCSSEINLWSSVFFTYTCFTCFFLPLVFSQFRDSNVKCNQNAVLKNYPQTVSWCIIFLCLLLSLWATMLFYRGQHMFYMSPFLLSCVGEPTPISVMVLRSSCDTLYLFLLSSSSLSPPLCRSVCLCKPHLLFQGRIFLFFLPCSPAYLW